MSPLLQDYLTRSAEREPEKVAVVMGEERLTYGELELASDRLARLLGENGCRGGERICLLLPKSPTAIAAMIGVLKAGGAYVPIDVSSPAPRVESIVRACEPRLVLACAETAGLAEELSLAGALDMGVGLLDDAPGPRSFEPVFDQADWAAASADLRKRGRRSKRGNASEDLAHILFTSGSTGVPKGVMITHSNVIHFVEWATSHFGTSSSDRISGHPPLHFDLSTFDIYGTLLAGAELHLVPASSSQPDALIDLMRDGELTQWFSVPSALTFMIKYGTVRQGDFPHLKRLIWCGEVIPTPTLVEWMRRLPHVEFTNLYGPTEATIASSYFMVNEIPADPTATISIGEACAGEELAVLDDELQQLPAGEIGEIYIGGVGLSPGYWRDAEKTAGAFRLRVDRPAGETRWYRTGDLGYVGADGLFYILGRVDSQVKSRGYRIELGEIEAALNALSVLEECAVVGVEVGGFVGTAICCAYSPLDGTEVSRVELRRHLARQLPTYMLPSHWLALEVLPKNLNGKIDRRELRERFEREAEVSSAADEELGSGRRPELPADGGAPLQRPAIPGGPDVAAEPDRAGAGPLAERLAQVSRGEWDAVVLEVVRGQAAAILVHLSPESIEPDRAFKELGLDSLGAVELSSRLGEATGLRLASTLIFDHPTPAAVARVLRSKVEGVERGTVLARHAPVEVDEPIAIVGMSCRYPGGVRSPEDLWRLLVTEGDAIGEFPSDRGWDLEALYDPDPDHRGTSYSRHGGFVHDVGDFDAGFFSIGPREALSMDPQQRLLLEGAWEAFEDAGIDPASLHGSPTGVFVGVVSVFTPEGRRFLGSEDLEGFWLTGSSASVVSGRVSYALGLEGPAVSVDTACSSSLVAMHLACQALRSGECSLALAGGVTVLSSPDVFIAFSRQRALSPDGRCRSFAAGADGTGWSEGVGLVTLERLADARRNGHRVLGLVRASAMNQDGASNGLTAPNGPSQERVIGQALMSAGLSACEVDAVEAHGTGTRLGDPIEAQALLATYGQGRPAGRPLYLGSVKSNLGHTQAAAGVAGVIKMVQALRREVLPKTLHVDEPSPHVDWSAGDVELLREAVPWPAGERPRRAGVSSFGVSGTNAHVILEEAPAVAEQADRHAGTPLLDGRGRDAIAPIEVDDAMPWLVSGKSEAALGVQARRLAEHVGASPGLAASDVAYSLALSRSAFKHRAVVLGSERAGLLDGLGALGRGEPAANVLKGVAGGVGHGVVFMFPGQGSQWEGMAMGLLEGSRIFAERVRACEEALTPHVDWSLEDVLRGAPDAPGLERVDVVQPVLFAVMVSLAGLWEACGVRPAAVIGHSQGEIAAAHVAGAISLADAARIVALRSRALTRLAGQGGMVSVALALEELEGLLERWGGRISVAAINGPSTVVVCGDPEALDELREWCEAEAVRTRAIPVDYASHSSQVETIRGELQRACAAIAPQTSEVPFFSTVTGGLLDTAQLDAEYWYRSLRETVQFEQATRAALEHGHRTLLEISPHPVLTVGVQATLDEALAEPESAAAIWSLRRGEGGPERFLTSLAAVWVRGEGVDWEAVFSSSAAKRVSLPTYAFQRERYWLAVSLPGPSDMASAGQASAEHPLLGAVLVLADERGWVFTGRLSLHAYPWLADHAVMGVVLLPGTAFLELALHAGAAADCGLVRELTLESPLALPEQGGVQIQISVGEPDDAGARPISIHSRREGVADDELGLVREPWVRHASGVLAPAERCFRQDALVQADAAGFADEPWPPKGAVEIQVADAYDRLGEQGYDYGPAFQGLRAAWRRGDEIFAEVSLPEVSLSGDRARGGGFGLHPALLDAALHMAVLGRPGDEREQVRVRLPFSWEGVRLQSHDARSLRVRLAPTAEGRVSLSVADETGAPVAAIESLVLREVSPAQVASAGAGGTHRESLLGVAWNPLPSAPDPRVAVGEWALLSSEDTWLTQRFPATGVGAELYGDLESLATALEAGAPVLRTLFVDCASRVRVAGAGKDAGSGPEGVHAACNRVVALVRDWLADERLAAARVVAVTRDAMALNAEEGVEDLPGAAIWGLLRSAQSEHPERFVLVDLDDHEASWGALGGALASEEPQLAIREGRVYVPRLARLPKPSEPRAERNGNAVKDAAGLSVLDGTVLVTGGTGVLGALVARHLVAERGVRSVVLASRRGPAAEGAGELEADLRELGARVTVAACDVTDREQIARLLESVPHEFPLCGIVHAAGVLDDGVIESLSPAQVDRVLAPKVDAAWHLHELTEHLDLQAFVLFSSLAGMLGSPGQGSYAAASAFLDGLAAYRRSKGLSGISLAWGRWAPSTGMTGHLGEVDLRRLARSGIAAMSPEEGLGLLDAASALDDALVVAARLDLAALRAQARAGLVPALLRGLIRVPARRAAGGAPLSRRLAAVTEVEREGIVRELVRGEVAVVLGHASPTAIDVQSAFKELGFDSLAAVELRNRLNAATELRLPATLTFDYPTPAAVADHLLGRLRVNGSTTAAAVEVRVAEIESLLSSIGRDDLAEPRIRASLDALASRVGIAALGPPKVAVSETLSVASDEELFELIDSGLVDPNRSAEEQVSASPRREGS